MRLSFVLFVTALQLEVVQLEAFVLLTSKLKIVVNNVLKFLLESRTSLAPPHSEKSMPDPKYPH